MILPVKMYKCSDTRCSVVFSSHVRSRDGVLLGGACFSTQTQHFVHAVRMETWRGVHRQAGGDGGRDGDENLAELQLGRPGSGSRGCSLCFQGIFLSLSCHRVFHRAAMWPQCSANKALFVVRRGKSPFSCLIPLVLDNSEPRSLRFAHNSPLSAAVLAAPGTVCSSSSHDAAGPSSLPFT